MKKKIGYYIHFEGNAITGVSKKINMQLKELNRYFQCDEIEITAVRRSFIKRLLGLLPFASIPWKYEEALAKIESPDFIYLRRTVADKKYIDFLKFLRKQYPMCKILVEIPTYPYDKAGYAKWDAWPFLLKDIFFRNQYKACIDRFVTYSKHNVIFGVPTIKAINGIDVDSLTARVLPEKKEQIDLVAVAYMQKHHGYERVIKGLRDYYATNPKRNVLLHFVGEGPEKKRYLKMVADWNLEKYVLFYGSKTGKELDSVYDNKDMGITALGMYKVNINITSELKSREYLAKGLPMITGCEIDVLNQNEIPYYMQFPNDNSEINISKVVEFYERLIIKEGFREISENMRKYAYENIDMHIALRPIKEYIVKE